MKTRVHSRGKGWYIFASNYKDDKDFTYINVYFPKNTEPMFVADENGKCKVDIDIQEGKFGCYQGKPQLTIFKYKEVKEDNSNMGGYASESGQSVNIEQEDLPFF